MTTTPSSSTDPGSLEIHLLGGGKGESIVIKLPDNQWGVVDCYTAEPADPDRNPTVQFLRARGVKKLLFVCLTHAHDDHYLGMVELIREFQPAEFWRFGCLSPPHLRKLVQYQRLEGSKAPVAKKAELTRNAKEFFEILKIAERGDRGRKILPNLLTSLKTIHPLPRDADKGFKVECLAPSGVQVAKYTRAILDCIGPDEKIAKTLKHSDHNEVSVVLKITFGETVVILGGDLETAGWKEVVREYGEANLKAHAVKVSHHGSENGYCPDLWKHFTADRKTVALIAPYQDQRLPKPEGLKEISKFAPQVVATCQPKLGWQSTSGVREPLSESRMILRTHMFAVKLADDLPCGQCSLTFGPSGNLIRKELTEPAVVLHGEGAKART